MKILLVIKLALRYSFDFARANVTLAAQLLSPRMKIKAQTIEMDTEVTHPIEILALSNLITFTPGTLAVDVKPGEKLTVHVLASGDGAEASHQIRQRLEEPLLEITRKQR